MATLTLFQHHTAVEVNADMHAKVGSDVYELLELKVLLQLLQTRNDAPKSNINSIVLQTISEMVLAN